MNDKKVEIVNNKSAIDYFKYVPIIYPILVFLGYINYDFYYRKFDIDIFNYLSVNEFLFSFVSLVYPILFFLVANYSLIINNDLVLNVREKESADNSTTKAKNKNESSTKPPKSFYLNKFNRFKENFSNKEYFLSILNFIIFLIFLIIYIIAVLMPYAIFYFGFFLVIVPLLNINNLSEFKLPLEFIDTPSMLVAVSIGWYVSFSFYIFMRNSERKIEFKKLKFY